MRWRALIEQGKRCRERHEVTMRLEEAIAIEAALREYVSQMSGPDTKSAAYDELAAITEGMTRAVSDAKAMAYRRDPERTAQRMEALAGRLGQMMGELATHHDAEQRRN